MSRMTVANIILLFVAFIWGATFVVVQNAIAFLEPHSFNSFRFLMAAVLLLGWLLLFKREQMKALDRKFLLSACLLGFWLFTGYALQTLGLLYTTSSKAGFITGLSVVLVPLLSFFILKVKPGMNAIAGVCIATAGLYLLTMAGDTGINFGDVLVFGGAVGFAMQIIYTGQYTTKYPALLLTVVQIICVFLFSGICAFLFEDWQKVVDPEIVLRPEVIIALVITSVLATAFAFLAQTYFQKYTTATHTALIFSTEPVFAALTAFVFAGERLGMNGITGSLCILGGMILAELPAKRRKIKTRQAEKRVI